MMVNSTGSAGSKHLIALVGFGTVATGLCKILLEKREHLSAAHGFDFEIVAVSTRSRGTIYNPQGFSLPELINLSQSTTPFENHLQDWDSEAMIRKSNATVVVELAHTDLNTAEPALTHCRAAFETGKHVISGNKGPAAIAYSELSALASKHKLLFLNEATVLSGTPVFSFVHNTLGGNRIKRIRGILNGTTNFILSEMQSGSSYESTLAVAADRGYLEADPAADIEGYDAQAKLAILANILLDTPLELGQVKRSGISSITSEDIKAAEQEGKRWKLVGTLSIENNTVQAEVKAEKLPLDDPLAQVMGTLNAITFSTDLLGDITITGPGAGSIETGYSILSDLLILNGQETS